ncbi:hypothetical protein RUM43_010373, partial [Polyplax serrata]
VLINGRLNVIQYGGRTSLRRDNVTRLWMHVILGVGKRSRVEGPQDRQGEEPPGKRREKERTSEKVNDGGQHPASEEIE